MDKRSVIRRAAKELSDLADCLYDSNTHNNEFPYKKDEREFQRVRKLVEDLQQLLRTR